MFWSLSLALTHHSESQNVVVDSAVWLLVDSAVRLSVNNPAFSTCLVHDDNFSFLTTNCCFLEIFPLLFS